MASVESDQSTTAKQTDPRRRRYRVFVTRNSGWSATDARGRRVPLFPLGLKPRKTIERPEWMDEATFKAIQYSFYTRRLRVARVIVFVFIVSAPFIMLPFVLVAGPATINPWLWLSPFAIAAVAGVWLMLHSTASAVFRAVARNHLAARRCPSCARKTLERTPDSDGCTTCPHCFAAWDLSGNDALKTAWLPSFGRPPLVTGDARGKMIEVFSHGTWTSDASTALALTPQEVRQIRNEAFSANPAARKRRRGAIVALALAALYLALVSLRGGPGGRFPSYFWIFWFGSILFGAVTAWRSMGDDPLLIVRIMLRRKRCPVCTYSIEGLPAQDDGCVICPECAAAWKLEPSPNQTTRAPAANTASTGLPPSS